MNNLNYSDATRHTETHMQMRVIVNTAVTLQQFIHLSARTGHNEVCTKHLPSLHHGEQPRLPSQPILSFFLHVSYLPCSRVFYIMEAQNLSLCPRNCGVEKEWGRDGGDELK